MNQIIDFFMNASPFDFCLGLIGVAILLRIVKDIIFGSDK